MNMTPTIHSKKASKSGRQTNNSLSSLSGNIFIDNSSKSKDSSQANNSNKAGETKKPTKHKNNGKTEKKATRNQTASTKEPRTNTSALTETDEVLQIGMHKVLEQVKGHKDAWPFMDPVEEDIAPRYYAIIRRPMDLQQMEERLDKGQYLTFTTFRNDFKLIVNNCRLYNGQNNEYTEMVNNLQHAFEKATKKYFDRNSSDEDGNLEYPDLKTNVFRTKNTNAKTSITPKIKEIIGSKGLLSKISSNKTKTVNNNTPYQKDIDEKATERRSRKRKLKTSKSKHMSDEVGNSSEANNLSDDHLDEEVIDEEVIPAKKPRKEREELPRESKRSKKNNDKRTTKRKKHKEDVPFNDEPDNTNKKKKKPKYSQSDSPIQAIVEPSPAKIKTDKNDQSNKKESKKLKAGKKRNLSLVEQNVDLEDNGLDEFGTGIKSNLRAKVVKENKTKTNKKKSSKHKPNDEILLTEKKMDKKKKMKMTEKRKLKSSESNNRDEDLERRSRSPSISSAASSDSYPSQTKFTVDLHAKYSKSASNSSNHKIATNSKAESKSNITKNARCLSPLQSQYSSDGSSSTKIKDKFDLIKERRGRNVTNDDKWKEIVKNAEKIKDKSRLKVPATLALGDAPKSQEKNQKLKETIEKLKQKNKQSKKLLTKLSDAKSSSLHKSADEDDVVGEEDEKKKKKEDEEVLENQMEIAEKSPFDLLKESRPLNAKSNDEQSMAATSPPTKKADSKNQLHTKKHKDKAGRIQKSKKGVGKNSRDATMEALELETEQTLKDINRWLEHTPRFPEFDSPSNSPVRFSMNNLLDDIDTVTSKLNPADFGRPVSNEINTNRSGTVETPKIPSTPSLHTKSTSLLTKSTTVDDVNTAKENKPAQKQTIQLIGLQPAPGLHKRDKDTKKKVSLKEKGGATSTKRKDLHRTIERMQPGKTKGNLISTIHNVKHDEISVTGVSNVAKVKEAKSSLVQEPDDSGPKLSLGTVLNTAGFGLMQQHSFVDNDNIKDGDILCDSVSKDACSDDMELEEIITSTEQMARDKERKEEELKTEKSQPSTNDKSATPNLGAWLKAFGVPEKQKKVNADDNKKAEKSSSESQIPNQHGNNSLPASTTRARKASTGSTISERSSYSQDPDSPRIAIDERICSSYPAPYPSPLAASPIMRSPKDDNQLKPASPYAPVNGSIRVGFYQDTTSKSSPEKSCSPREQPSASPYSNYAQHLYVSTTSGNSNLYSGLSYTSAVKPNQHISLGFNKNKSQPYYDQYKQPKSQDSDYNSSVGSNPNSPYQSQHSPYQSENSSYQQSQTSPFAQQPHSIQSNASSQQINLNSPNSPYQSQHSPINYNNQNAESSQSPSNSYHSSPSSPYAQPNKSDSPYQPNSPQQKQSGASLSPLPSTMELQSVPAINPTLMPLALSSASHKSRQSDALSFSGLQNYPSIAGPPAPRVINSSSAIHEKPKQDDEQQDILNLDYVKQTSNATKSILNTKSIDPVQHVDSLNKPLSVGHGFDHSFDTTIGFNKSYDISSTKAIEMFNRAATMSFSKTKSFPAPLPSDSMNFSKSFPSSSPNSAKIDAAGELVDFTSRPPSSLLNAYQSPATLHSNYSLYSMDSKSTHLACNPHDIDGQVQPTQIKHSLYSGDRLDQSHSTIPSTISNDSRLKSSTEINIPTLPTHRYDVPSYDQNIRNTIIHPLIDDNLNGSNCFYPPKEHVASSLYANKNVLPPSQTSPGNSLPPTHPYGVVCSDPSALAPPLPVTIAAPAETKPKRTRKKKNVAEPIPQPQGPQGVSVPSTVINQMIPQASYSWGSLDPTSSLPNATNQVPSQQHPSIPNQAHSQQGFQSYPALKPPTQSAIGSAFNFGPASGTSLGLSGIYGENSPYLEDYRATTPYYLPPQTHRSTTQPDQPNDRQQSTPSAPPASYVTATRGTPSPTYHQFLSPHPYTNPQIYQQYLRTEEYRQRMMFANPSLLLHTSQSQPQPNPLGATYAQPNYHPALGMHKPYGW